MAENYDNSDCPINIVDPYQNEVNIGIFKTLTGRDCQSSSSSPSEISSAIINDGTFPTWAQRSPLPSYTLNGGSSPMALSPSMPLATTIAALRDTEPGGAASSPRTLAISQSTIGKYPTRRTIHGMSVSEHPLSSYDPASSAERCTVIEDDVLNTTIPIVRGVLAGAAKSLDAYLPPPRDNIVMNSAPTQLDARGSTFSDVGRDQHYHVYLTVCSHCMGSNITPHHRPGASESEHPNTAVGFQPEPDRFKPLLERGVEFMVSARTFVATSFSAVVTRFKL